MDDFPSEVEPQSIVAALRALITPGVYAAELETSPLVDLPAVEARAGPEAPRTMRAQVFIELLESVINARLNITDRRAASILFGIGTWSGMPVRERHYEVAKLRNKRWTWERNYRKEPLTRDLLTVARALIREDGAAPAREDGPSLVAQDATPEAEPADAGVPAGGEPDHESGSEAEYHLRRLGRRRTAYPLDMSLEQLQRAGLIVPVTLGRYHERQASRRACNLEEIVGCVEGGSSVLLLGEPGAGKTLAMYQLATACLEAGLTPIPIRARDTAEVLAREGWQGVRDSASRVVVLLDGLDEAMELIAQNRGHFAADLREVLSAGPYVVSSRVREYEELISGGFPDPGFDVVYVIEPWALEAEFREYLSRLARAGLLNEPTLYEAVVASDDLARLVSRPLYARMLTFVGEQAARGLRDQVSLYGEYLTKLARVTDYSLESQGVDTGGALRLWQSAAWIIYSNGGAADDMIPLADVEQRLPDLLPRPYTRRVLDQIIERGSSHGRETGEFIHYSFYEYLVAREAYDRILRNPGPDELAEILKGDLPRDIRHYLIGQLRVNNDTGLRETLLGSYASVRRIPGISDRDMLSACNLLIYLISRVLEACEEWLHGLLADEDDPFLRHSILWAMCHLGSDWALREFSAELAARPSTRSECRGYMLYYYGDMARAEGPPYHDDPPHATDCSLTYRRVIDTFGQPDFTQTIPAQRSFIDMHTFLDILAVRGMTLEAEDNAVIATILHSLRAAGLPPAMLTRLGKLAARAGFAEPRPPRPREPRTPRSVSGAPLEANPRLSTRYLSSPTGPPGRHIAAYAANHSPEAP
jgi:hypothetical protein